MQIRTSMNHLAVPILSTVLFIAGCSSNVSSPQEQPEGGTSMPAEEPFYFPPVGADDWETKSASSLGWNETAVPALYEFLENSATRSFLVLVNGRIVFEEYFNGQTSADTWQWNSAGKTLVTATTGIAYQQGIIDIDNSISNVLGSGWTNAPVEKESLITIKNLLSMTSGLDDEPQLVVRRNLNYVADAGTRWAYGNVFQKLMDVVEQGSGIEFESYFNTELAQKIGMQGFWDNGLIYRIYNSTARDMARFGLLALQNGTWGEEAIIDESYFLESVSSSQQINPSYGLMWWLNGQVRYMKPGEQTIFQGEIVPNAPSGMYAAMGAQEQRLYIVPERNLVVIRMGENAGSNDASLALSAFDNLLWELLSPVIGP